MTGAVKPVSDLSDDEWLHALYLDAFEAMLAAKSRGDMQTAKNALSDMYLGASCHLKDDSAGVWAYLYDWGGDVTQALLERAEQEAQA